MIKKSITFSIILLFIGVSFSSAYSNVEFKNEIENFFKPVPKLECRGNIIWKDVKPNTLVTGTFDIRNNGEEGSILNWTICPLPDFGSWHPEPGYGTLTPNCWFTITMYCRATEQGSFSGEIEICNADNMSERCSISVTLTTPRINTDYRNNKEDCGCKEVYDKHIQLLEWQLNRIERYSKLLVVLSIYYPKLKEISDELSNKIFNFKEALDDSPFPVICDKLELIVENVNATDDYLINWIDTTDPHSIEYLVAWICHEIFIRTLWPIGGALFFIGIVIGCWEPQGPS